MKLVKLVMLLAQTASGAALAQEHAACNDHEYQYEMHTPGELRTIAASCKSTPIANLFYNRAYHYDLVSEATALAELIVYSDSSNAVRLASNRLYVALLEQMAPIWYPDWSERVAFLNREYDRRDEIARLRLRGYDHIADRLERNFSIP